MGVCASIGGCSINAVLSNPDEYSFKSQYVVTEVEQQNVIEQTNQLQKKTTMSISEDVVTIVSEEVYDYISASDIISVNVVSYMKTCRLLLCFRNDGHLAYKTLLGSEIDVLTLRDHLTVVISQQRDDDALLSLSPCE